MKAWRWGTKHDSCRYRNTPPKQFNLELRGLPRQYKYYTTAVSHAITNAVSYYVVGAGILLERVAVVSMEGVIGDSSSTTLEISTILLPGTDASAASVIITRLKDNVGAQRG